MKTLRPSSLSRTLALVPPTIALVAQHAGASFDAFIKIDDIKGESTDGKFPEWVVPASFSFGVSTKLDRSSGQPVISSIATKVLTISKPLDSSSPELFLGCVTGTTYKTVTLALLKSISSGGPFYRLTLNDVVVTSVETAGSTGGDDKPAELISLNFSKIKIEYFKTSKDGSTEAVTPVTWEVTETPRK